MLTFHLLAESCYPVDQLQHSPARSSTSSRMTPMATQSSHDASSSACSLHLPPTSLTGRSPAISTSHSCQPYFVDYTSLPGTTLRGDCGTVVAQGRPQRVIAYDVAFVGQQLGRPGCHFSAPPFRSGHNPLSTLSDDHVCFPPSLRPGYYDPHYPDPARPNPN
ncbi:hypothetical protein OH77DRAFT_335454 [Trametes cingulata]|nr:hypothetical protein OH77DRAFT_335454 [Trametes cingulata]